MTRRALATWTLLWVGLASAVAAGVLAGSLLADVARATSRPSQDSPSPSGVLASSPLPARTGVPTDRALATQASGAPPSPSVAASPRPATTPSGASATGPSIADARAYALARLGPAQFACLDELWQRESHWRVRATNRTSGAYGIPQAYPAERMATAGADWRTNPLTQVRWGLGYIEGRYGSACTALGHALDFGWY